MVLVLAEPATPDEAADLNGDGDGDGVPDLWTVTPDGIATPYAISHLSTTSAAKVTRGKSRKLT